MIIDAEITFVPVAEDRGSKNCGGVSKMDSTNLHVNSKTCLLKAARAKIKEILHGCRVNKQAPGPR